MSIEVMEQALAALETCRIRSVSEWSVEDVTPKNITAAITALRTAIQQAEAKTDEMDPLFVKGALSGIVDAQVRDLWPTKSATHPAPGVPDDVMRDAERWRTFLATRPSNTHEGIIAAIDAAQAQKGQP